MFFMQSGFVYDENHILQKTYLLAQDILGANLRKFRDEKIPEIIFSIEPEQYRYLVEYDKILGEYA